MKDWIDALFPALCGVSALLGFVSFIILLALLANGLGD